MFVSTSLHPTAFQSILQQMDPLHAEVDCSTPLMKDVWESKYKASSDRHIGDTFQRVVDAIYGDEASSEIYKTATYTAMNAGLFIPAGRILAGAGTNKRVTLMNCYVNSKVKDSMEGIMESLSHAAFTMQQGGGVGTCFSTIRPKNAIIKRVGEGAVASGPLPFMDMWNSMCGTIMSAGSRRGAMMATICDTHPDLLDYIKAKQTAGRLTNFNMSILITDAFMEAVQENAEWILHFHVEPIAPRDPELEALDFVDDSDVMQYVYSAHMARDLWETITKATYEYSEPGVIFIDRINSMNNLNFVEDIQCTNPCGEQPLPPHGTCNLGAIVLSRMVNNPFTDDANFNWDMLEVVTRLGVCFLDNVIDVTNYPLEEQRQEEMSKRRLGLGITGLADCLAQMGLRYGSLKAAKFTNDLMRTKAIHEYTESLALAKLKGPAPITQDLTFGTVGFIAKKLPAPLQLQIIEHGLRNALISTIAPTGTTSIVIGNVSSGVEPTFAHQMKRKVLQADNTKKGYTEYSYSMALYNAFRRQTMTISQQETAPLPSYMVQASDLSIADHIRMQAACQEWIDASVSKTVNIPTEMPYEDFIAVYDQAYHSGCKGCTTYRPNAIRGSILDDAFNSTVPNDANDASDALGSSEVVVKVPAGFERPEAMNGTTYKVRWPSMTAAMYITINKTPNNKPYEMFFASKDARHSDWMTALTLMISGILRSGIDPTFIAHELKQVTSMHDTAWINGKFYSSPVAFIGNVIEQAIQSPITTSEIAPTSDPSTPPAHPNKGVTNEICTACLAPAIIYAEGCKKCTNCGHSTCN